MGRPHYCAGRGERSQVADGLNTHPGSSKFLPAKGAALALFSEGEWLHGHTKSKSCELPLRFGTAYEGHHNDQVSAVILRRY